MESTLKHQIQIGSRSRAAFFPTFYYTMPKIAFASSCWQCQSAERQAAFIPARSYRSTHKPACRMYIVHLYNIMHCAFECCAGVRSTRSQRRNCIFLQRRNYCATLRKRLAQSERAWQCTLGQPVIACIGGLDHRLCCQRTLASTPF